MATGKVILAGAGPGDAELITVKLSKALQKAEVVITDRLVNLTIITAYCSTGVEIVEAGKQGYNNLSASQDSINELLVHYALQGKYVVRLKGGDVAFFSNVLDELQTLKQHKIPFEIIPGITAASGASAYAAIPLTARGYSRSVRFLLYENDQSFTTNEWHCLGATTDTLVLYMGVKKLPAFLRTLKKYTDEVTKQVAIIEQATTPQQRVHIFSLQDNEDNWLPGNYETPGLVIIGSVTHLHNSYKWFTPAATGTVFNALNETAAHVNSR